MPPSAAIAAFPKHADGVSRGFGALVQSRGHRTGELLGAALGGDLWQLVRRVRWSTTAASTPA
jgi:hypothetical protein